MKPQLPALYRSKTVGSIVLFTDLNTGIQLNKHAVHYGHSRCGWNECTNTAAWERLPTAEVMELLNLDAPTPVTNTVVFNGDPTLSLCLYAKVTLLDIDTAYEYPIVTVNHTQLCHKRDLQTARAATLQGRVFTDHTAALAEAERVQRLLDERMEALYETL